MSTITAARVQDSGRRDAKEAMAEVEPVGRPSTERSRRSRPGTPGKTKSGIEALRARSSQRAKSKERQLPELPIVPDLPPPKSRDGKGRQFTVGNVGHGGIIFLKPVERQLPRPPPPAPKLVAEPPSPTSTVTDSPTFPKTQPGRSSVWAAASSAAPPARTIPTARAVPAARPTFNPAHQRSYSQSTIDARLANEKLDPGAMKIVIDRHEKGPREANGEFPSLRVSIPHYRLGSPRFSAMGSAFWRGSMYTMSSVTGDHHEGLGPRGLGMGGDFDRVLAPAGLEAHAVLSRRHSHASPQPYAIQTTQGGSIYTTIGAQAYTMPVSTGPISPQMFDAIASDPQNPTIVQHSPINGEILAASPARLIAQITSDNFLDYELLSDFFLTVRSYMSTHDLLAYLLARFEWAINRFDDNGRVIRVRAFAALRHWILNYFSYDFVVDRDLRVQLCDRLNALTKIVKARADYGASDMKLIADLKKCWNGRCAMYWDNAQFPVDSQQDADIHPGGVVGSSDSSLVNQTQLHFAPVTTLAPQLALNPAQLTAGTPSIANWYTAVMQHSSRNVPTHTHTPTPTHAHMRQTSNSTSRSLPISPTSELSMPVMSCSIPAKTFRRALPYATRALGLHPIPANGTGHPMGPAAAPVIANEPNRAYRRSGSFSDAVRDRRAPLSSEAPEAVDDEALSTFPPSVLRGHSIMPPSPLVLATPTTPGVEISMPGIPPGGRPMEQARKTTNNPSTKSFLGNIRRALSSRYTPPNTANNAAGMHASAPALGKSVQVPFNVLYQSPSGQLEHFKGPRRIDLLAKRVFDAYQMAVDHTANTPQEYAGDIGVALGNESAQPSPFGVWANHPSYGFTETSDRLQPPGSIRKNSAMTDGSQSIMIMDDTHDPHEDDIPPVPPIPALNTDVENTNGEGEATPKVSPSSHQPKGQDAEKGLNAHGHRAEPFVFPFPALEATEKLSTHGGTPNFRHTQASSISLRRYASYQSTLSKSGNESSIDRSSRTTQRPELPRAPARMLRRRPGGDLRANQNVHDLEDRARPKSAGSITTYSESIRGSIPGGFGEKILRPYGRQGLSHREAAEVGLMGQRVSLVQTSSLPEKRRPSFEAAVAEFAQIPDDDEGGIEVTLLKLEGKYKSPLQSPIETRPSLARPSAPEPPSPTESLDKDSLKRAHKGSQKQPEKEIASDDDDPRQHVTSTLYAGSEDSYNSVPLLERGEADESNELASFQGSVSVLPFPLETASLASPELRTRSNTGRLRYGSAALTATTDSFLLDEEDEFLSDLSSELSVDTIEPARPAPLQSAARKAAGERENMVLMGGEHPPSPPMTMQNAAMISSHTDQAREQRKPPTPDTSPKPTAARPTTPVTPKVVAKPDSEQLEHMPFVLGFEAEAIAQQLTLLEAEALKEVDWRDLVDMRWQSTATATTNWVEYLATTDPIGIDLVTARFNIMVKWALSEIVLTASVEERAMTIVKYIHVAQQARRHHNYATLLQITIALTSPDCTRLGRTWNRVPEAEKEILTDLEMLVSPKKNFANLRGEMEKVNADAGCIPVVALYTHDLIYNAQKPTQLPGPVEGGEPLINFERFRSTAVIVKNLLRLIDASRKYTFPPTPGLVDHCLWMAALPDDEIAQRSKQLEFA